MVVTMVRYTKAWNVAFKTSKPLWKIWKYKINIFYETNLKAENKEKPTVFDNIILLILIIKIYLRSIK